MAFGGFSYVYYFPGMLFLARLQAACSHFEDHKFQCRESYRDALSFNPLHLEYRNIKRIVGSGIGIIPSNHAVSLSGCDDSFPSNHPWRGLRYPVVYDDYTFNPGCNLIHRRELSLHPLELLRDPRECGAKLIQDREVESGHETRTLACGTASHCSAGGRYTVPHNRRCVGRNRPPLPLMV